MRHSWERTFQVAAEPARVWKEFTASEEPQSWNNVLRGDPYYSRGAVRVEMRDEQPEKLLRWDEIEGSDVVEMTVTFTEVETGTRITITRAGFGEGDAWEARHASRLLGWVQAMHDFAVYLQTGVAPGRMHFLHWACDPGMTIGEVSGGLRIVNVTSGGWAATAGLQPGDLVIGMADTAVFDRSDLWLLQTLLEPGGDVAVEYVRDGAIRRATARL